MRKPADVDVQAVDKALAEILSGLSSPNQPAGTRAVIAEMDIRRLRAQLAAGRYGLDPETPGQPETDPAPELTAMAGRLASVLRTLGDICDAPGMTRHPPDELARWLRYGASPGQDGRN